MDRRQPQETPAQAAAPACVLTPQQTQGPYFVDERLNRSDLRPDPSDRTVKDGEPLRLAFHVTGITGSSCAPLPGAVVDVWHCDALGIYSDIQDINGLFDTRGKKFLRGYQVTEAGGNAQFTTIYPGWYEGRTVHIHFKIRTNLVSGSNSEFTSQLYFNDSVTDQVHAQPPYAPKGQRTLRNDRDSIYRSGGDQLMLQLIQEAQGHAATFAVGLQMT